MQVSAYAYILGCVTMLLALPHSAVLTGIYSTTWQVRPLLLQMHSCHARMHDMMT